MSKTYTQLVNAVLVNLRESTVSSVAQTAYSNLIGAYVNQAKEKVEDAWAWKALTVAATFNTVAGVSSYLLDGTDPNTTVSFTSSRALNARAFVLRDTEYNTQVFCTGSNVVRLTEYAYENLIAEQAMVVTLTNQPPYGFAYSTPVGIPTLLLARPADTAYAIAARFCAPQDELTAGVTLLCPYRPVISYATYLAMQERGEELGTAADMYLALFNDELARAITNEADLTELQND